MTLRADLEAMHAIADEQMEASVQVRTARDYLNSEARINGGYTVIGRIIEHHERAAESLRKWLYHLNDISYWSAMGIHDAVGRYQRTDVNSAANFDAALPPVHRVDPYAEDGHSPTVSPSGKRFGE